MSYSIGIWAEQRLPHGVVYRWEADGGAGGTGYLLLETTIRPSTATGSPSGTMTFDAGTGAVTGETAGVDKRTFTRTAAAILKRFLATQEPPETAHTYFA